MAVRLMEATRLRHQRHQRQRRQHRQHRQHRRLHVHVVYQLQPEGRNARGGTRLRGPEVLGPRNSTPRFSNSGSRKPPRRGPLRAPERLSEASERCVRFQRSGETRWATQRPIRGPVFRMPPERVPTPGLLPSGQAPKK